MKTKRIIDAKYARAYDSLTLAELIQTRGKLQRDIEQETRAADGSDLRAEIAKANRSELFKQLNAVEQRYEQVVKKL